MGARSGDQQGQSTVEWTGLLLVVALLFAVLVTGFAGRLPGAALAGSIADRLVCAVRLGACVKAPETELVAAYGAQTAAEVVRYAPEILYEEGSRAMPVDFRSCRSTTCGDGPSSGVVTRSDKGEPATAFVHVVRRGRRRYIQYWLYYANSSTYRGVPYLEGKGYHDDDWESFQVRLEPGRPASARASSHRGYNGYPGAGDWASDAGVSHRSAWAVSRGRVNVAGGSHAGRVTPSPGPLLRLRRLVDTAPRRGRWTPGHKLRLVPVEGLAESCASKRFAVSPPWCKRVYADPEYAGTD